MLNIIGFRPEVKLAEWQRINVLGIKFTLSTVSLLYSRVVDLVLTILLFSLSPRVEVSCLIIRDESRPNYGSLTVLYRVTCVFCISQVFFTRWVYKISHVPMNNTSTYE